MDRFEFFNGSCDSSEDCCKEKHEKCRCDCNQSSIETQEQPIFRGLRGPRGPMGPRGPAGFPGGPRAVSAHLVIVQLA